MNDLIKEYQCPGCVAGPDPETCASFKPTNNGCGGHVPGTLMPGIGTFMLGMPKGFNRLGPNGKDRVYLYERIEDMIPAGKELFNVVVWKHLDKNGNSLFRVYSPRINSGNSNVVRGNHMAAYPNAIEITEAHIANMD